MEYTKHCHKKKDLIRQQRLIEKIKPSMFIRYNEMNNTLTNSLEGGY